MIWLIIGPQTRAARAQTLLGQAGITAKRRRMTEMGEGCLYAVGVSEEQAARAGSILEGAGIRIRKTSG